MCTLHKNFCNSHNSLSKVISNRYLYVVSVCNRCWFHFSWSPSTRGGSSEIAMAIGKHTTQGKQGWQEILVATLYWSWPPTTWGRQQTEGRQQNNANIKSQQSCPPTPPIFIVGFLLLHKQFEKQRPPC